jgi:glycine/D-amino acid oxidase-like deaminating enzyme
LIAVIGAGVVGTACALALQRAGHQVTLIDRDEPGRGCSFGNAGHIATEQGVPLASFDTIKQLPAMMLNRTGPLSIRAAVLPQLACGWAWRFLMAARPADYARGAKVLGDMADHAMRDLRDLLAGTPAQLRLQERGHHVVWQHKRPDLPLEPWRDGAWPYLPEAVKSRIKGGMTYRQTGHVTSPLEVTIGLRDAFLQQGGQELRMEIAALGDVKADRILVATGVDAPQLLKPLGYKVPMIAERGYHVAQLGRGEFLDRPIVFHERNIIVTPMEGELRATTTTEFSPRHAPANPHRWEMLKNHVKAVGLWEEGVEIRQWMGNRPTLPDYLPVIGRSRRQPGLFFAFGHQHLGLTLSGTTARLVRDMLSGGGEPPPELCIERFS